MLLEVGAGKAFVADHGLARPQDALEHLAGDDPLGHVRGCGLEPGRQPVRAGAQVETEASEITAARATSQKTSRRTAHPPHPPPLDGRTRLPGSSKAELGSTTTKAEATAASTTTPRSLPARTPSSPNLEANVRHDLDTLLIAVYSAARSLLPAPPPKERRERDRQPCKITHNELMCPMVAQMLLGSPSERRFLPVAAWRLSHLLFHRLPARATSHEGCRVLGAETGHALACDRVGVLPGSNDSLLLRDTTLCLRPERQDRRTQPARALLRLRVFARPLPLLLGLRLVLRPGGTVIDVVPLTRPSTKPASPSSNANRWPVSSSSVTKASPVTSSNTRHASWELIPHSRRSHSLRCQVPPVAAPTQVQLDS